MVSRLRLCRATQSAIASASATVVIASTSIALYSPKIKVDVIGSKPSGSPKSFGRSPTIAFPGAVKTFTLSVFEPSLFDPGVFAATGAGAVMRVVSFGPFVPAIWPSFDVRAIDCSRQDWQKRGDESIGRTYRGIPKYWLDIRHRVGILVQSESR